MDRIGFRARILSLKREACERTHDERDAKNARAHPRPHDSSPRRSQNGSES
jgi:hypothetical protein